ncbi:YgfZ/GcvT domain-containing protein [Acidithiobacillus sp. M4-SHS-6]|uniref:CAF17-like 4Fe-4S cluster assembly/insertion protein YgfZ n=1 Tax=Acidithiobacillus sp. M4-SHS-6 TaxID=3383024 RepID=UPI0039BDD720
MSSAAIQFSLLSSELGLIHAHGADAEKFLQGQFSNDLRSLTSSGQGQWSSYSTAKGRMIANFYVQRVDDHFWLSLSSSLVEIVAERLRKFRMMAKLEIENAEPAHGLMAIYGTGAGKWLAQILGCGMPEHENGGIVRDDWVVSRLPWAGQEIYQMIAPAEKLAALRDALMRSGAQEASGEQWRLTAIQAGVGYISLDTSEKVIPQELNLEVLGGINFKKGCYPGQEIVARSHYLGKLKNQMYAVSASHPLPVGTGVFADSMGEQSIGLIINSAASSPGQYAALAVLRAANIGETLRVGALNGAELLVQKLPYTLPLDMPKEA